MIYFLQADPGSPIKIGFSDDVDEQHKELEAYYGRPLTLLGTMEGDRKRETEIHQRFEESRIGRTEQFRPTPDLMAFIGLPLFVNQSDITLMEPVQSRKGTFIRVSDEFAEMIKTASSFAKMSVSEYLEEYVFHEIEERYRNAVIAAARRFEAMTHDDPQTESQS